MSRSRGPVAPAIPPLVVIVGPTATGKSALAVALALRLGGEIIGADSMQVYRGLDAATAKPEARLRKAVPHHLIDVAEPGQDFSMGDFVRLAEAAIAGIAARAHLPIVVGGTGLYVRGLLKGPFEGPRRNEPLRERLRAVAGRRGGPFLHRMLLRVDAEAARRIQPNDPQRIVRALEVWLLTRRTLSEWFREEGFAADRYPSVKIGLDLPREELYRRIDDRVGGFVAGGLFDEVDRLIRDGRPRTANAFKALGYREALAVLDGRLERPEAVELIRRNTRRYAKRQLTWFRKEPGVVWLDALRGAEDLAEEAEALVRPALRLLGWDSPRG